jgi:DNA invertase Pin-like site-specific DNA recombinase
VYRKIGACRRMSRARVDCRRPDATGCSKLLVDKANGKLVSRPELDEALMIAARAGDQLVITKLDRLGRSLEHLIALSTHLQARGVDLVVLDQGIDTSTALGRMFFQILGAIAEFEHALMSERTRDGLDAARARGAQEVRNLSSRRAKPRSRRTCTTSSATTDDERTPAANRRRVRRHPADDLPPPATPNPLTRSDALLGTCRN